MLTAVATKSLKIVIFNHLMLVDANCDDSVTIPRCPNLVVDLKVSVALKKKLSRTYACILAPPPPPPPLPISNPRSTPGLAWLVRETGRKIMHSSMILFTHEIIDHNSNCQHTYALVEIRNNYLHDIPGR